MLVLMGKLIVMAIIIVIMTVACYDGDAREG
jgi:hypothetical protein